MPTPSDPSANAFSGEPMPLDLPRPPLAALLRRQLPLFACGILLAGGLLGLALAGDYLPAERWLLAVLLVLLPAYPFCIPLLWRDGPASRDLLAAALHAATPAGWRCCLRKCARSTARGRSCRHGVQPRCAAGRRRCCSTSPIRCSAVLTRSAVVDPAGSASAGPAFTAATGPAPIRGIYG